VILLAMFGAGINLTRRVPEIQEEYSSTVPRAAPLSRSLFASSEDDPPPDGETQRQTFAFRRALIQNYMYVLSAPFLATAVYYLLQVVATEPARPILVLVSFATGLISDTLVNRIVRFAEETLKLFPADKAEAAREAANARINHINATMLQEAGKAHEAPDQLPSAPARGKAEGTPRRRASRGAGIPNPAADTAAGGCRIESGKDRCAGVAHFRQAARTGGGTRPAQRRGRAFGRTILRSDDCRSASAIYPPGSDGSHRTENGP